MNNYWPVSFLRVLARMMRFKRMRSTPCARNRNACAFTQEHMEEITNDDDAQLQAALALSLQSVNEEQKGNNNQQSKQDNLTTTTTSNSTPSANSSTVDEGYLNTLVVMGFPEVNARKALLATNNNLEAATSWILNQLSQPSTTPTTQTPINPQAGLAQLASLFRQTNRIKMVLVVRTDLKMGVGKIAAQCGHAAVGLYQNLAYSKRPKKRELLKQWEENASPKIALKVTSYEEMTKLEAKAKSLELPTHVVLDAGRTQVAPGSATVLAIIGPTEHVDQVTGGLKLL